MCTFLTIRFHFLTLPFCACNLASTVSSKVCLTIERNYSMLLNLFSQTINLLQAETRGTYSCRSFHQKTALL